MGLEVSGDGPAINLRIVKKGGSPVSTVPEGTPGATVVAVRKVNLLDTFTLGLNDLADKLDVSPPRALSLVRAFEIQKDTEMYQEIRVGSQVHKRYSQKAVAHLASMKKTADLGKIWEKHGPKRGRTTR